MPVQTRSRARAHSLDSGTVPQRESSNEGSTKTQVSTTYNQEKNPARRVSVFREVGLGLGESEPDEVDPSTDSSKAEADCAEESASEVYQDDIRPRPVRSGSRLLKGCFAIASAVIAMSKRSSVSAAPPTRPVSSLSRFAVIMSVFLLVVPTMWYSPRTGKSGYTSAGVRGRVIKKDRFVERNDMGRYGEMDAISKRANSPTDICTRWSHQSALVNGTIYVYGGRAKTDAGQTSNTWNNDFISFPLSNSWQIASPTVKGLAQPSGPPPVANGFLWSSYTSLFLYGGEFSDTPVTSPVPFSLWEYNLQSSSWINHQNPVTSSGNNSEPDGVPVQGAAEGAGLNVAELGRGWYFGGHLDGYTTAGWSQSIARVYLKSLLEFTFPSYTNDEVSSLQGGKGAGSAGVFRNITQGGLQDEAGFPERADGILAYIPGWGKEGILIGMGGGTNATLTQMNVIDVFDIATSTWYKQATSGTTPQARVNPCSVVASAPDGSSFQVYMYGGQNLLPANNQQQYDDLWILTIPSFTWIKVDTSGQSNPPARAGHSCDVWDGQMIVVGGYVGQDLSCDSPGIYVFDLSNLKWENGFTTLSGGKGIEVQPAKGSSASAAPSQGLAGSYGYTVPQAVQSIVGGNGQGSATITAPVESATDGPIATGKPPTWTVTTGANGATITAAATSQAAGKGGPNKGAIIAGVLAAVFFLVACYFAFCAFIYRKQLALYKHHTAMAQQQAAANANSEKAGFIKGRPSGGSSQRPGGYSSHDDSGAAGSSSEGTAVASSGTYTGYDGGAYQPVSDGASHAGSSVEDLMAGQEPSFLGVLLSPRRSLRVINRD